MKNDNINHAEAAAAFLQDREQARWHDSAIWWVRQKRDAQAKQLPEWEQLRALAQQIKAHTLSRLDEYLEQFQRNAEQNGVTVHWAADADEHNRIVHGILAAGGVKKLVKSKSMLTEECGLNPYLEQRGIEVIDTDLGERIVQLRHEPPSHIVMPAIHLKKEQISELFHKELGTEAGNNDPTYLTHAARANLREHFLTAGAGLTGVNFAIAETGGVVVCTNEGNADLGTALPPIHIASMGLEKIIPKQAHLGVFTRLLARSAIGSPITTYTSHFQQARPGGEMHIVIVDNGRSDILGSDDFSQSLRCIRCGACMNTCPVYRRSTGHSYSYIIPGPIGSTLGPSRDIKKHGSMAFACTTCGSCSNVCPVKINLHEQLILQRKRAFDAGTLKPVKKMGLLAMRFLTQHPSLMDTGGKLMRKVVPILPQALTQHSAWSRPGRDLPQMPAQSFKEMWQARQKDKP
ncbi:L-lactate dehydrogenase complex protein LldF [Vogesella indigofera]|uniref:L-lactate dehydrogenase complex protein LldF n=1 Tax=Vogesella indigofera TaxID=45465 RepID=A0A495BCX3_VOGIN|nr:lactate utilization protein B [Vogesella indigofera]RKQ58802.1 L-lactate dehydrogenase complex protein LldF [Vogesella indigofera]